MRSSSAGKRSTADRTPRKSNAELHRAISNVNLEAFVSTTVRTLAVAGFVLASALPAAAQEPSAERVKALIAQAMAQQGVTPTTVPQAGAVFQTPGPKVDLSLTDAVQRGTEKNIDIAVARITPQLTDFTIV